MPSIHYDPKLDRRLKKEAAKNAIKKVKDAVTSTKYVMDSLITITFKMERGEVSYVKGQIQRTKGQCN